VVDEVAVVALIEVDGPGVLGPQLRLIEPQVGRTQEALRQVEQVGVEGQSVQAPRSPRSADPYWDEQTLADTQTRYPRADLTPYG
jgi:hypothetical protein